MLSRTDWLLLFLGMDGGLYPSDQVRVMKGLFLISQIDRHPLGGQYRFEADEFGPFDARVYRDLDQLQLAGLMKVRRSAGSARKTYELTEAGEARYASLAARVPPDQLADVGEIKRRVTSQGFDDLLHGIASEHPEYVNRRMVGAGNKA